MARTGADRHRTGQARYKFLTWSADADIPEVRTLAATVDRWWNEIAAFIDTGHSNAKSEGINRVIKLVARAAFGFRNATNQRIRTRCVTTREPVDTSAPLNFADPRWRRAPRPRRGRTRCPLASYGWRTGTPAVATSLSSSLRIRS
ncbi:transposase [Streptomyces sp. NPDC050428]|uniref:transposase n=1 Tax=Streptomyces sp. NPDC050428 TaxID=3155757 RepID=UPI003439CBBE